MAEHSRERAVDKAISTLIPIITEAITKRGVAWIGIGTGTTIALFMSKLSRYLEDRPGLSPAQIIGIPTSFQSQQLILESKMIIGSLLQAPDGILDAAIDGADEVDFSGRYLIKGGGAAHTLEKIVAASARHFYVVVDDAKINDRSGMLGLKWKKGVPLAILSEALVLVTRRIISLGFKAVPRIGVGKIGPIVSDQGHMIVDVVSDDAFSDLDALDAALRDIVGVVEHGLFTPKIPTTIIN